MAEIGAGEGGSRVTFISNELGPTHFVDGEGTIKKPYKPQGSTLLEDSILDSFNTAMYKQDNEVKIFFEHNGHIVGIDRNMQPVIVTKEGQTTDLEFQKSVEEITKKLHEGGHRVLTEGEVEKWQEELKKEQIQREKRAKGPMGFIDKIIEKIGI